MREDPASTSPSVTAVLGPTNTGKTHRAIERMLEHATGAIGVPLRLLAREVYDKLTTRVGENRVALVTGEEKRVPRDPSYWVCTVEAMPSDLAVDFLAIDEVQLAAHDQRGHVFTDRILHARGRKETWFLGADTIRPVLEALVPGLQVARLPRLSSLTSAAPTSLAAVPPRSAVVAFSVEKVFELAERIKARKGGAAVVLGVLSPRARNAQVAMFQSGEVDHLVATDAIGMGLNLDVHHVAFAALRKFDGREPRDLDPAEVGQIAGRAGRHTRDGTFGAIAPLAIPRDVIRAVESHRFPTIGRVRYRSTSLDFSSIDALVRSLGARPGSELLRLDTEGEDLAALVALARVPEVSARANREEAVRRLWDVCRIPDYRKLLFESHVALLAAMFVQLEDRGAIDERFLEARVREIDDPEGGIETLTARLSAIRTFSYVANQSAWIEGARGWQARTRAVEDRLSDALHARLVERFVERTSRRAIAREKERPKVDASHPFSALAALRVAESAPPPRDGIEELIDAPHERFALDRERVVFEGREVARLSPGASLLAPDVRLAHDLDLAPGTRSRVLRRVVAFARDVVDELVAPLRSLSSLSAPGRGLVYQLERSLGTVPTREARAQIDALDDDDRRALEGIGLRIGACTTYLKPLLREAAIARRATLSALHWDAHARPPIPKPGAVSIALGPRVDPRACLAIGFVPLASDGAPARRAVRADVVEGAVAMLASEAGEEALARKLGVPRREVARVVAAIEALSAPSTPARASGGTP